VTNKQLKKKIRRAFSNATPNRVNELAAKALLSGNPNRKEDRKPTKPVKTSIQFRAIATLAASVAIVILIGGTLLIGNPGNQPGGSEPPAMQMSPGADNPTLGLSVDAAYDLLKDHLKGQEDAPELPKPNHYEWEYQLLGEILVYKFNVEAEPDDIIAYVYPSGEIYYCYAGKKGSSTSMLEQGRFIGLDAAIESIKEYAKDREVPFDFSFEDYEWELELDAGRYIYQIEFHYNQYDWVIWVDAEYGKVWNDLVETHNGELITPTDPSPTNPTFNTEGPPLIVLPEGSIDPETAISIALKDANLNENDVSVWVEANNTVVTIYNVHITHNGDEYVYTIRANDGKIVGFITDYKDSDTGDETRPPDGKIDKDMAIEFVLEDVGITDRENIINLQCEEDADGLNHYDVTFVYCGYAYKVEIGMYNPNIISASKEPVVS